MRALSGSTASRLTPELAEPWGDRERHPGARRRDREFDGTIVVPTIGSTRGCQTPWSRCRLIHFDTRSAFASATPVNMYTPKPTAALVAKDPSLLMTKTPSFTASSLLRGRHLAPVAVVPPRTSFLCCATLGRPWTCTVRGRVNRRLIGGRATAGAGQRSLCALPKTRPAQRRAAGGAQPHIQTRRQVDVFG